MATGKKVAPRMKFIAELREYVIKQCGRAGFGRPVVEGALEKWDSGAVASAFQERVLFDVFRQVQENVEKQK